MSPSYFLPVNSLTIANRIVTGSLSRTRVRTHAPDPPSTEGQSPHPSHPHAVSRPNGALGGQAPGHGGAPQSAHAGSVLAIVGVTLAKVAAFFAVMLLAGKAITALARALVFRRTWPTALTITASVAQIGEFSFILAGLGLSLRLLPPEGLNLIVAGALFSIALNPLLFRFARTLEQRTPVPAEGGVASVQT